MTGEEQEQHTEEQDALVRMRVALRHLLETGSMDPPAPGYVLVDESDRTVLAVFLARDDDGPDLKRYALVQRRRGRRSRREGQLGLVLARRRRGTGGGGALEVTQRQPPIRGGGDSAGEQRRLSSRMLTAPEPGSPSANSCARPAHAG